MKKIFVGSLVSVLTSAGLAMAQAPLSEGHSQGVTTAQATAPAGAPNFSAPLGSNVVVPLAPTEGGGDGGCCGPLIPHWPAIVEPCGQWYGSVEYMLMWSKNGPVDYPLVTSGLLSDPVGGALGQPNTHILFNAGAPLDYGAASGTLMTLGYWFDRQGSIGIEGSGLIMEQRSTNSRFTGNGSGSPLLGQPFINTNTGAQDFNDMSNPLVATGGVDIASYSQLYGFQVNLVSNVYRDENWSFDFFGGFQWMGLDENLSITNVTVAAPGATSIFLNTAFPPPGTVAVNDSFTTHNHFYGGDLGGRLDFKSNNWLFGVGVRLGLGDNREEIDVRGSTALYSGPVGPIATAPGGFFAGPNNMGRFTEDTFAVIPQVDLKVGYQFNSHVSASVGWMFLYWSDVVRPGSQIDPNVNPNHVPSFFEFGTPGGAANPVAQFSHSEYWIQGVTVGIEVKF